MSTAWVEPITRRPWLLIAATAFCFNLGLSLTGFYNWTFDSWAHMFFASHYMRSWFDTWDPRWFGGFSVTSYPPLVTQTLALGGFVFGLEHAYALLSFACMILFPVALYCFSSNFLPRRQAMWAGILALFLPSIYLTNYTWGQLPSLFALITALFTGCFLWRYLAQGRFINGLLAALLVGITAASHHLTFICLVPLLVITVAATFKMATGGDIKSIFRRLLLFGFLSLPLVIMAVYPFLKFALTAEIQEPIFHITRANLFTDVWAFLQFVLAPYFLLLLVIPFTPLAAVKQRYLMPLLATSLLLFLLGLGGSTPLPRLIFGPWADWLTYERFALWASVLFLPLVVKLLPFDSITFTKNAAKSAVSALLILAVTAMCLGSAYLGSEPLRKTFSPSPPVVSIPALLEFLDGPEVGQQYRYITLGFGEAQMQKLSALSNARSLDGTYYTARTLPVLRESAIASLDAIKYFDSELKTLDIILTDAAAYNLKWVLVNDVYFYQVLQEHGFILKYSAENRFDNRLAGVTIWEKDDVPPIAADIKNEKGLVSYLWGIAPLSLLTAFIALLLIEVKRNRCSMFGAGT